MAKILAVTYDLRRLFEVNNSLRAAGYAVRGADCASTLRHWLAQEPFHFVIVLDDLPSDFAETLRKELHAGRISPRLLRAEGLDCEDVIELLSESSHAAGAA